MQRMTLSTGSCVFVFYWPHGIPTYSFSVGVNTATWVFHDDRVIGCEIFIKNRILFCTVRNDCTGCHKIYNQQIHFKCCDALFLFLNYLCSLNG